MASFLDEHLLRLQRCLRRVSLLPSRAAERAPDCQVAALLLRHCGTSRAQHLLRALPPRLTRAFAVRADELLREAFVIALGLPGLDAPQQLQLTLPTAYGGMGVTPLEATAEAAYLGAAAQVHEAAGGGLAWPADVAPTIEALRTRHGVSVRAVLGGDLTDPATGGNSKVQKRLTAAVQLARPRNSRSPCAPRSLRRSIAGAPRLMPTGTVRQAQRRG